MAKEKTRPKYNMAQNSWFMIKLAWTSGEKKVLVICLLLALSAVALNLINLYVSPAILAAVERKASVTELILTIAVFTLALMFVSAVSSYGDTNAMYGRVSVRSEIITLLNRKAATTSYPNLFDEKFKKLQAKASEAVSSNRAPCEAVWTTLTDLTANILGFAFYVVLMSSVQPLLLAVILATTVLSYLVSNYLGGWEYRHRDEAAEYEEQMIYLNRRASDLTLAKDIRIFGLRPWIEELYEKSMAAYTAFHKKAESVIVWAKVTDLVLTFFRNAAAYAYLTALVIGNRISVSEFLLLFSAAGGFTTWISGILGGFHTLHSQSLEISTVREYLEYPEPFRFEDGEPIWAKMEMQRGAEAGMRHGAEAGMRRKVEPGMRHETERGMQREAEAGMQHETEPVMQRGAESKMQYEAKAEMQYGEKPVMQYEAKTEMRHGAEAEMQYEVKAGMPHEAEPVMQYKAKAEMQYGAKPVMQYEIRLENVSFRYPGAEKDTLTGIDLTLHPGEKLAVVGLNGAGKTTLVKLICGFLDPTGGRVLLNGRDIRVYNRRDYYTMFSAVFQEFSLLAGTVAVNVAQDDADIDMERVKECVRRAGLGEKIESLKDGYETLLNRNVFEDAVSLSGGETQRLMLARALYKDAPFLILDEPTAALDPIAESELYQKYHEMTRGKSSVYISHRLASTRFCDRILMIADGGIAEMGTHEELLRMGGRYAGLYRVQSRYYEEGADENGGK